jgi:hypothetical protein
MFHVFLRWDRDGSEWLPSGSSRGKDPGTYWIGAFWGRISRVGIVAKRKFPASTGNLIFLGQQRAMYFIRAKVFRLSWCLLVDLK